MGSIEEITKEILLDNILSTFKVGIFWKDNERRFCGANQMFLDYYNLDSVNDILGKTDEDMGWHIDPKPFYDIEMRVLSGEEIPEMLGDCIVKGDIRKIKAGKFPIIKDGKIIGIFGHFRDVTEEMEEKERLERMAQTDALTGLYNRHAYSSIVKRYVEQYTNNNTDFGLVMIDLNDFKMINDTYGHEFGNLVLKSATDSILKSIENNSVAFRYGGDEFVIIHQIKNKEEMKVISQRIATNISVPKMIENKEITITASVGHEVYSEAQNLSMLIEIADNKMYQDKQRNKRRKYN